LTDPIYQFRREIDPVDFDLARCVVSGQVFRWESPAPGHWRGADGATWWDAHEVLGGWSVVSNQPSSTWDRFFRGDVSGAEFRARVTLAGPEVGPLFAMLPGHRLLRPACAREVLFSFVCTANNHLPRIRRMVRHLAEFGIPMTRPDGTVARAFPTLDKLVLVSESQLRAAGFGYRAAYVTQLVQELVARGGETWLDDLRNRPTPELRRTLRTLPGVGPKVADCVALFGFDRTEVVPVDTHVWQIAVRHYFPDWAAETLTARRYEQIAEFFIERFGPDAGWAHQVLFCDNLIHGRSRRIPKA